MLEGLKRLFSRSGAAAERDWEAVARWAQSHQYTYRGVPGEGFVVDGRLSAAPWRLEWGPSKRPYIQGTELRLRSELGLAANLQMVVMNRELQEAMEKAVFAQYVEGVQTRIDNQTPPEMRWLVMFAKLAGSEMPALRERYVAIASQKGWMQSWLEGPLSQSLAGLKADPARPVVLMIGRGRLMLRTAMPEAEVQVESLLAWLRVFETAMREARRVANESSESTAPSTQPSLWSANALPGDERHN